MFPLVPAIGWLAVIGGGAILGWYADLTKEEKADANRRATDHAKRLFDTTVDKLTQEQANHVARLTQRHFENAN